MRQSFPNRPFFSNLELPVMPGSATFTTTPSNTAVAPQSPPSSVSEVVAASAARRDEVHAALEADRIHREWLQYDAFAEASRVEAESRMTEEYDAGARLERGQGNREFVLHFAVAACVTMGALVGINAVIAATRAR